MIYPDFDSPTNPQSWFQLQGVPSGEIKIQVEYVPFRQVGTVPSSFFRSFVHTNYFFLTSIETTVIDGVFRAHEGRRKRYLWQGKCPHSRTCSRHQLVLNSPSPQPYIQVMQVRKRDTSRIYAMKVRAKLLHSRSPPIHRDLILLPSPPITIRTPEQTIRKQTIASRNEITHTLAERTVLAKVSSAEIPA